MKVLNKVMLGAAALVLLTGCANLKEVSYEEFHNQAVEASQKEVPFTKVSMKGKITYGGIELTLDGVKLEKTDTGWEFKEGQSVSKIAALWVISDVASVQPDGGEGCKYYFGGDGFKYTKDKSYKTWNKYGLLTKCTFLGNYSVSYSK